MKRILLLVATLALLSLVLAPGGAAAQGSVHVTGGGTGTFGADIDANGGIDGSTFAVGVVLNGSAATGHWECLMAGRSQIGPFNLMAVQGTVTSGSGLTATSVTLDGTATV